MNTTTSMVLTGSIVMGTYLAEGKKIPPKMFVGLTVLIVLLAALTEANAKLGQQFGLLVLVAASFTYGERLSKVLAKGMK